MNKKDQKLYYSIGEIAKRLKVNNSLIRFWQKEFEILKPKKNSRGNRIFTINDVKNISLIYFLLKEKKYTIKGAKKRLRENKEGTIKTYEVITNLKKVRSQLEEIREELKK